MKNFPTGGVKDFEWVSEIKNRYRFICMGEFRSSILIWPLRYTNHPSVIVRLCYSHLRLLSKTASMRAFDYQKKYYRRGAEDLD